MYPLGSAEHTLRTTTFAMVGVEAFSQESRFLQVRSNSPGWYNVQFVFVFIYYIQIYPHRLNTMTGCKIRHIMLVCKTHK